MEVLKLKKEYNKKLQRNKAAEEYFKTHTIEECLKQLNLFNQVVKELSCLIKQIEELTKKKITDYEKINGFNV